MKILENFSFANLSAGIFLIGLIPLYIWLFKQETSLQALKDKALSPLMKRIIVSSAGRNNELFLLLLGMLLIFISLMRPRFGYETINTTYNGVDIAIAVDVSDSMLVEDLNPNRLGVAKRKIQDILGQTLNDRIALISAAGTSFIESPLTLDKTSIAQLADVLQPDLAPIKGSSLSSTIQAAEKAFSKASSTSSQTRSNALILLTDGEYDQDDLEYSEELLSAYKIVPYGIIFGTPEGGPIPSTKGFKRDATGKLVISKIDLGSLSQLFKKFNGKVLMAEPSTKDVHEIVKNGINSNLRKDTLNYQNTKNWKEYFQYPLLLGILIVVYTWRKSTRIILKVGVLLFFLFNNLSFSQAEDVSNILKESHIALQQGKFKEALETLSAVQDSHESTMLKGNILYRLARFAEAEKEFAKSASLAHSPVEKSHSLFNRANALLQSGKFKEAKADYESALKDNPSDSETENNLKYVKKLLEDPPQDKDKDKEEDKDEEKKQEENNDKDKKDDKDNQKNPPQDNANNKDKEPNTDIDKNENKEADSNQNESGNDEQGNKPETLNPNNDKNQQQSKSGNENKVPEKNGTQKDGTKNEEINPNQEGSDRGVNQTNNESLSDQSLSQLNSIEEDTSSRQKYRYQQALTELEKQSKPIPRRDW